MISIVPDYIETKAKKCMKITMCEETYHTLKESFLKHLHINRTIS